ncbi:phytanoyl-CoA dioxygenase family protein [Sphingomonas rubra]|nr:phytanoyl-CoA dioxygenase family protein [Sphingomonas rubra]
MPTLNYDQDGAALHHRRAASLLGKLEQVLTTCSRDRAGIRLAGITGLAALLKHDTAIGSVAAAHLGSSARPVRAILFDKSPTTNWALGWHQDRTIAVQARHEIDGFSPWSVKAGIPHVEPPFALIEGMVTLRIHLDDVPPDNAPLLVARGSHRLGRIAEADVDATVARCGVAMCCAVRGDIWCYATPILHASAAASGHAHRRVLQVDFSATQLPDPLVWYGI